MKKSRASVFDVHHWIIPSTTSDYPILAVARDRSALLSLGEECVSFDWGIPKDAKRWLARDFAPTGQTIECDLPAVRYLLQATFVGGAAFGMVRYDDQLKPTDLDLGLVRQQQAEQGAEYLLHDYDRYQRFYREPGRLVEVTTAEQAMLNVCFDTFADLAKRYRILLRQPPPPRFRAGGLAAWGLSN